MRRAHALAVDAQQPAVDRVLDRVGVRHRDELAGAQVAAERDRQQQPAHRRRQSAPRACRAAPRPRPARGGPRRSPASPRSTSARPTSSANSGLPSVASTIRRRSCRGRRQPEPLGAAGAHRAEAQRRRPRARSQPAARAPARAATGARNAEPAGTRPGRLEPPRGERERVRRRRVEPLHVVDRDQHRLAGGQRAQRVQQPERDRAAPPAARPPARRVAARPRSARAAARAARELVRVDRRRSRSISAANESRASAPLGRRASTRSPAPRAASTPASQSVVLPMPGPPVSTSAPTDDSGPRSPRTAANSDSRSITRPTSTPTCTTPLSHTTDPPRSQSSPRRRGRGPPRRITLWRRGRTRSGCDLSAPSQRWGEAAADEMRYRHALPRHNPAR